jgi:hypothetical protein
MKKYFWVILIVVSAFSVSIVEVLSAETDALVQAGVAAAVKGEVRATTSPDTASRAIKSGDKIFMGDKVETGADGQLQILLLDRRSLRSAPQVGSRLMSLFLTEQ